MADHDEWGRMRMWRAFVTAAVLVLATACTATPEPPVVESGTTPAASESPTASSPAPTSPAPTSSGEPAEEFARQYVRAINTAFSKGDVAQLRNLAEPSCTFCMDTAKSLESFHAKGGAYEGDPTWHITEIGKPAGSDPVTLSMYVQAKAHKVLARAGAAPEPQKARTLLLDLTLDKEDGQWKVKDLVVNG